MLGSVLKHHQEFQAALDNYRVSDRARQALEGLKLVLMVAPTSGGRNTTIQYLLKTGNYYYIISDTTRQPRINDGVLEQNGVQYWFRTEEEILADIKRGEYLEAEIIHNQQVSGISIREIEKAHALHKIAITDIEIKGVHNILRAKKDAIVVMLLPPSFEEWQRRIARRGKMRPEEVERRLRTAALIFEEALREDFYQFVVADDIERSAMAIDSIAHGQPNREQGRARGLIERLQFDLNQKLETMRQI